MKKTVIFGGTFNPVHLSHIKMAQEVSKQDFVDEIWIMPSFLPPHKKVDCLFADGEDRMNMCKLAFRKIKKVKFCDFELKNNEKSYTVNTLKYLTEKYPSKKFCLLIGGDMLASFEEWFCYKEILCLAELLVVKRPDVNENDFLKTLENLKSLGAVISVLNTITEPISSTEIRNLIKKGLDTSRYLEKNVNEYIIKNNLYRG